MRVLRAFLSSWLPAASLLMIGTAARASEAIHLPAPPANAAHLSHGRFKDLLIYRPAGAPTSFVLFLSGDAGWNPSADAMARQLVRAGRHGRRHRLDRSSRRTSRRMAMNACFPTAIWKI